MKFGKGGEGGPSKQRIDLALRRGASARPEVQAADVDRSEVTPEQIKNWEALVKESKSMQEIDGRKLHEVLDTFAEACTIATLESGPKIAMVRTSENVIRDELGVINTYLKERNMPQLNLRDLPAAHWRGYQRI